MLKKQFIFLALTMVIFIASCSYASHSQISDLSELFLRGISIQKSFLIPLEESRQKQTEKEVELNIKDKKLAYVYKNRAYLKICEGNRFVADYFEKSSMVYQVNSQKYIIEFGCAFGAYAGYTEYLLFLERDNDIEIKPLPFLITMSDGFDKNFDFNDKLVWLYGKGINGLPRFDPDTLILKNSTVKNNGGYKAEYKFEDDEFKLLKYTIFPDFQMQQKGIGAKDIYP
jgi:hypothetical protein